MIYENYIIYQNYSYLKFKLISKLYFNSIYFDYILNHVINILLFKINLIFALNLVFCFNIFFYLNWLLLFIKFK